MTVQTSHHRFASHRARLYRVLVVWVWGGVAVTLMAYNTPPPLSFYVGGGIAAAVAFASVRAMRMRLDVDDSGATVRNFVRNHECRWDELEAIRSGYRWGVLHGHTGVAFLKGDKERAIVAEATASLAQKDRSELGSLLRKKAALHGVRFELDVDRMDDHPSMRRIGGTRNTEGR